MSVCVQPDRLAFAGRSVGSGVADDGFPIDVCVSAALDAVKERVTVPWRQNPPTAPSPPAQDEVKPAEDALTDQSSSDPPGQQTGSVEMADTAAQTEEADASAAASPDSASASTASEDKADAGVPHVRSLAWRNFEQALKEITPSASEALGSLAELRKWNDEFGEGRKAKKRQVWGKDRFGFTVPPLETAPAAEGTLDPGVATPANSGSGGSTSDTSTGR